MRKHNTKKILSILLLSIFFVTIALIQVAAMNTAPTSNGAVGESFTVGDLNYEITSIDPAEVAVQTPTNSSFTKITIQNEVDHNGTTYSVTTIGAKAFYYCSSLSSIDIPNSVTTIGDNAFSYCSSLSSINIPNSVTTIGDSAFSYCSSLSSINIPSSVTAIGVRAFYRCESLSSISFLEGLTTIGKEAFTYCINLSSIVLPEGLAAIGDSAFSNCTSLSSIDIPNSVTTIEPYTFYNCTSLSLIALPEGLTTIREWAFTNCKSLSLTALPEGLTTIEYAAFYNCTSLALIFFPEGIITIDDSAFEKCENLNIIVFRSATVPTFGEALFRKSTKDIKAYVPWESKADYKVPLEDYKVLSGYDHTLTVLGYGELVLTESSLADAILWEEGYNQSITTTDGIEAEIVEYTITSGALPEGLSMDDKGNITGTATKVGASTFTVTATVANAVVELKYSDVQEYTINVKGTAATVTVHHVDENGKVLADPVVVNGFVGTDYKADPLDVFGHTLKATPANETGKFTVDNIDVTYIYSANAATVTVHHVDENGKTLISPIVVDGFFGKEYATLPIAIAGHTLKATPDNAAGKFTVENIEVTYIYSANAATVTVHHVDENGKTLISPIVVDGFFGKEYATLPIAIAGHTLKATPDNAAGKFTVDNIDVTYIYEKVKEPTTEEPTTEEPTIVTEKTTEVATAEDSGTDVETGDAFTTPLFFIIALFSVTFILANRKKEELQG